MIRALRLPALVVSLALACAGTAAAAPTVDEFDVPTPNGGPTDITLGPDGNLWYVEQGAAKVGQVVPGDPPTITDFDSPSFMGSPITGLQNINVGPDGSLWVTAGTHVAEIPSSDPTGGTVYSPTGLMDARGIAPGFDGNMWIVDAGAGDIKRVTTNGTLVPTSLSLGATCGGRNITRGPDGNMWVTCFGNQTVVRVKGDASSATPFDVPGGGTPWDIIVGVDGNLWFTGQGQHVSRITPAGSPSYFTSKGVDPFGITRGPDGALWYAEFQASAIGRVTTDGDTSQITGLTANSGPRYIVQGPNKELWFTEQTANKIGRVTGIEIPDVAAPKVLSFTVKPRRWRRGSGLPRLLKTTVGTVFTFRLSEAARARFTFARRTVGRRVGGRCVRRTKANRRRKACVRYVTKGSFSRKAAKGRNRLRFAGRVSKRKRLAPGRYRATLRATDAAGNRSRARRATFRIVR